MEYHEYFRIFLSIEDELVNYISQLEYSEQSKNIYSPKLSLLLLQTCPIIESYMVELSTKSKTVITSDLYNWQYSWKLWEKEKKIKKVKGKNGVREIKTLPKFSYVCQEIFNISEKKTTFYFSDRVQNLPTSDLTETFQPYKSLSNFISYKHCDKEDKKFPIGLQTPQWWSAYNKIKHNLQESKKRVKYRTIIESIAGLFVLLAYCEPDINVLFDNKYIIVYNDINVIKTKLFQCNI